MSDFTARRFATYELVPAKSGALTARHVPSGLHLHSAYDPRAEARTIADALSIERASNVMLIGCGLGYLANELRKRISRRRQLTIVEPDGALAALADVAASRDSQLVPDGCTVIRTTTAGRLSAAIQGLSSDTTVVIAPYLATLARSERLPLSDLLNALHVERCSDVVYRPLLKQTVGGPHPALSSRPSWETIALHPARTLCVVGAGPSLDPGVDRLRAYRSGVILVAASGAVPALLHAGLTPDVVVVLEHLRAVTVDLEQLPSHIPVIAFAATAPEILVRRAAQLYRGDEGAPPLESRGGTTIIPALDFALRQAAERIVLLGVDLGQGPANYARHAQRPHEVIRASALPPKFAAMRFALESLIQRRQARAEILHVLLSGVELRGTRRVDPTDWRPDAERTSLQDRTYV